MISRSCLPHMRLLASLRHASLAGALLAATSLAAQDAPPPRAEWTVEPFGSGFWFAGEHLEAEGRDPFSFGGTSTFRSTLLRLRTGEQFGGGVHLLRTVPERRWGLFFEAAYTRASAVGGATHFIATSTGGFEDNLESSGSANTMRAAMGGRWFFRRDGRVELFGDAGLMLARTSITLDDNIVWLPRVPLDALDGTSGPGIEAASVTGGTKTAMTHGGPVLALGATFPIAEALRLTTRAGLAFLWHDQQRMLDELIADDRLNFWIPSYQGARNGYRLAPTFTVGLRFGGTGIRRESAAAAVASDVDLLERHATVYSCPGGVRFSARLTADSAILELPYAPVRLVRDRRVGRLQYMSPDVTFTPAGDRASLESRLGNFRDCRGVAADTPWDEAALLGYDFRAIGQEPGWLLDIEFDGEPRLRFIPMEGERVYMPLPAGRREADGRELHAGEWEGTRMEIEVAPRPCNDAMSGASFTHTVRVKVNDVERTGCGRRLTSRPAAPGSGTR